MNKYFKLKYHLWNLIIFIGTKTKLKIGITYWVGKRPLQGKEKAYHSHTDARDTHTDSVLRDRRTRTLYRQGSRGSGVPQGAGLGPSLFHMGQEHCLFVFCVPVSTSLLPISNADARETMHLLVHVLVSFEATLNWRPFCSLNQKNYVCYYFLDTLWVLTHSLENVNISLFICIY